MGFRPAIHRLASALSLAGSVANDPEGATVEVEGPAEAVDRFLEQMPNALPPLARLDAIRVDRLPATGRTGFAFAPSTTGPRSGALVPPDAALCRDCQRDMQRPGDRRHGYAFTTCTNCGPRFTLVRDLPYDRERTAMACFPMCEACAAEYRDPADRRFHAEPICCPQCGPRLWLADRAGTRSTDGPQAVSMARRVLLDGQVLAIKALGGFQLACRADRSGSVRLLRERKRRPRKPFAVMARDLAGARELIQLRPADELLLTSARAPILLAPRRPASPVALEVAPGIEDLGVLLPNTPLHTELFRDPELPPLVMTSGNVSDEPICRGNREAIERLGELADYFLLHDRDVVRRTDDSVARSTDHGPVLVRRARGWVPEPLPLPLAAPGPILAVGGHLQNTACVAVADQAFLSQHVGDLDSIPAREFLTEVIDGLLSFLDVTPRMVVCDLHPDYPSTWLAHEIADRHGVPVLAVQHHLAHGAAVLGEHRWRFEPGPATLVLALDGTGWGPDGTAWGGEWLILDSDLGWRRVAHLEPLPLVGGERAVREPWRVAAAALALAGAESLLPHSPLAQVIDPALLSEVARLAGSGRWPLASGAGRLFEACGALLGLTVDNDWEGEAAVALESLAASSAAGEPWPEVELDLRPAVPELPSAGLLAAAARRLREGAAPAQVAAGFHASFCSLATHLSERIASRTGAVTVAVGGGCMVNRLLRRGLTAGLESVGLRPLLPCQVPAGDGGLAFGQVVLAAPAAALDLSPRWYPEP